MQHTTEELMLAAMVRDRASELLRARTMDMENEEADAYRAKNTNAVVEEALQEIEGVAGLVKKLRARAAP